MYQIAVRQTLLYRRKQGRRRKLIDRYADATQPTEADCRTPDPLTWLIAGEQADLFRQAMANLPGRDREILMLKYHHEWSYREIAQQLDVSESAVEARLHRARYERLRQRLVRCQGSSSIRFRGSIWRANKRGLTAFRSSGTEGFWRG